MVGLLKPRHNSGCRSAGCRSGHVRGHRVSRLLWLCVVLLAISLTSDTVAAEPAKSDRPNVLLIFCDDLGWGDLGCFYQNDSAHERRFATPQLDRMAAEGMQLRAHYCAAPVCAPSRSTLLTGVHQGHATVRDNQFDKALPDVPTLGTVMQAAGYRTAIVGKYGLQGEGNDPASWPAYPTRRGFDQFYGYVRHVDGHVHYPAHHWPLGNSQSHRSPKQVWDGDREVSDQLQNCYTTDLFTAKTKQILIDHANGGDEKPFFVYLAYDTPHAALQIPSTAYPEGSGVDGGIQWLGEAGKMINTAVGPIDSYRHPDTTGRGWTDVQERFATMVRRIDNSVGDLLQTLRDLQLDKNTLVVFTSDNGPHHEAYLAGANYAPTSFESYGIFDGTKRDCLEGGIRMPTLAWWPESISAGEINHDPSQSQDWLTTFADVAGIEPPARADGVSLLPTLTGEGKRANGTIYIEYFQNGRTPSYEDFAEQHRHAKRGQMQVVHVDGYKGLRYNVQNHDTPFEIYDLEDDLSETNDLASRGGRFEALQQKMKDRVLRLRRPNPSAPRPYDDALIPALDSDATSKPLQITFRPGQFTYVPRVGDDSATEETPTPRAIGSLAEMDGLPAGVVHMTGMIEVPRSGRWQASLRGGPAVMRVHDAAVIDSTLRKVADATTSEVNLEQGRHPVTLTMLVGESTPEFSLRFDDGSGDAVMLTQGNQSGR